MLAVFALFTVGLMWAYYLPAIPAVLWLMAICSWFLLTVESVIAAPLFLIAHSFPEGEGFTGQHARQGYVRLFGILLRPSLLVIGIFLSIILIRVLGNFTGIFFSTFLAGMTADITFLGPIGLVMITIIQGTAVILIVHKAMSVITHVPDTVMLWIGQGLGQLGEERGEAEAKAKVAQGGSAVSNLGTSAVQNKMRAGQHAASMSTRKSPAGEAGQSGGPGETSVKMS